MKYNRAIEDFILSGHLAIDVSWGMEQLAKYLHDVALVSSGVPLSELGYSENRKNQNTVIYSNNNTLELGQIEQAQKGSVAHVKLSGVMRMNDGMSGRGVQSIAQDLQALEQNPNVSSVVLEVNSGGGESTAGFYLHNAIKDFSKPIVVWGHTIGSAALAASVAADKVYLSSEASEMGSIGTMITIDNSMLNDFKERFTDYYSSKSPDKNKWFRDLLDGKKSELIKELDENASAFQNLVTNSRKLNAETQKETLSGGMFGANDAINRGLADGIKTFKQTISTLQGADNLNNSKTIQTMNFQSMYEGVISRLNSFFGWSLENNATTEQVNEQFSSLGNSFTEAVNNAVVEATGNINSVISELKTSLENSTVIIAELKAEIAELKSNDFSGQIAELNSTINTLKAEKTDLEKQVISLSGRETESNSNHGFDAGSSAGKFMDAFGNVVIEAESKY